MIFRAAGAGCSRLALIAVAGIGPAAAQDGSSTNRVDAMTDWSVFEGNDPRECWAVTTYKESVNTKDGRVVAVNRGRDPADGLLPPGRRGVRGRWPSPAAIPSPTARPSTSTSAARSSSCSPKANGPGPRRRGRFQDHHRDEARRRRRPHGAVRARHSDQGHVLAARLHRRGRGSREPLRGLTATARSGCLRPSGRSAPGHDGRGAAMRRPFVFAIAAAILYETRFDLGDASDDRHRADHAGRSDHPPQAAGGTA